jgi:hypothetical protein
MPASLFRLLQRDPVTQCSSCCIGKCKWWSLFHTINEPLANFRSVVKLQKQILSAPPFACTTTRWVHAISLCFWAFGCMLQLLCWYLILHSSDLAMLCPWLEFWNNLWNTVCAAATQLYRNPLVVSEASMQAQSSHVHLTKLVWYTLVSCAYENWLVFLGSDRIRWESVD